MERNNLEVQKENTVCQIAPLDFVRAKGKRPDCHILFGIDKDDLASHPEIAEGGILEINDCILSGKKIEGKPYEKEHVGLVTEVSSDGRCSVEWLGNGNKHLHNAWWKQENLEKIDSLPHLLARKMAHPFGNNEKEVDKYYRRVDFGEPTRIEES